MSAFAFFYDHAGYSHDPKCETPNQARRRRAQELAQAEARKERLVRKGSIRIEWSLDADPYETDDEKPDEVLECRIYEKCRQCRQWRCVSSLGGIGDPSPEYRRVIEAELMLEID